jgi:hypothetical protein
VAWTITKLDVRSVLWSRFRGGVRRACRRLTGKWRLATTALWQGGVCRVTVWPEGLQLTDEVADLAAFVDPSPSSRLGPGQAAQRGTDVIVVKFAGEVCQSCLVKAQCTTATRGGRQLTLRPRPVQEALDQARAEQSTTDWQRKYARRAGVESTIAQAVKVTNARHTRYRGLPKVRLEHNTMAAALNLIRLDAWFNGEALNPRRTTHLSRLDLALAA